MSDLPSRGDPEIIKWASLPWFQDCYGSVSHALNVLQTHGFQGAINFRDGALRVGPDQKSSGDPVDLGLKQGTVRVRGGKTPVVTRVEVWTGESWSAIAGVVSVTWTCDANSLPKMHLTLISSITDILTEPEEITVQLIRREFFPATDGYDG